jgi:hypothetical protein
VHLHNGQLVWCGEHWIAGLRCDGEEAPSAWVSLFHTRYSGAGEGNAAQVIIPPSDDSDGINVIATDNPEVAEWINARFFANSTVKNPDAPLLPATFTRAGATHRDPSWIIEVAGHRIETTWHVNEAPVIANGSFRAGTEHFTILFFTDQATIYFDRQRVEGQPYMRDIWMPSIGGMRSSCVFALAETFMELPDAG